MGPEQRMSRRSPRRSRRRCGSCQSRTSTLDHRPEPTMRVSVAARCAARWKDQGVAAFRPIASMPTTSPADPPASRGELRPPRTPPRSTRPTPRPSAHLARPAAAALRSWPHHSPGAKGAPYSGMLPCFFGGKVARLLRSARSACETATRVRDGGITPSTYPRSAAVYGLASAPPAAIPGRPPRPVHVGTGCSPLLERP